MGDLLYVVKVMIITVAFVLLSQVRIGQHTFETVAHAYLTDSWLGANVSAATAGGWKLARETYSTVARHLDHTFQKENAPGGRSVGGFKRSRAYLDEKAQKTGEILEGEEITEQ